MIAANIAFLHDVSIAWPWPEIQADDMTEKEIRNRIRNRRRYNTLLEWEVKRQFKDILMTLDKFLYGDTDKEKEAYQKGFMDGMRAARVELGFYKDGDMEEIIKSNELKCQERPLKN